MRIPHSAPVAAAPHAVVPSPLPTVAVPHTAAAPPTIPYAGPVSTGAPAAESTTFATPSNRSWGGPTVEPQPTTGTALMMIAVALAAGVAGPVHILYKFHRFMDPRWAATMAAAVACGLIGGGILFAAGRQARTGRTRWTSRAWIGIGIEAIFAVLLGAINHKGGAEFLPLPNLALIAMLAVAVVGTAALVMVGSPHKPALLQGGTALGAGIVVGLLLAACVAVPGAAPVLATMNQQQTRSCMANVRNLAMGVENHCVTHGDLIPASLDVPEFEKFIDGMTFTCPLSGKTDDYVYLLDHARGGDVPLPAPPPSANNRSGVNISNPRVQRSKLLLVWENEARHGGKRAAAFADGHAVFLTEEEFQSALAESLKAISLPQRLSP